MSFPRVNFVSATCGAAAAALAMLGVMPPAALAQDRTVELKLSHWVPPTHPLHKAMEDWGNSVQQASNGTIKFKIAGVTLEGVFLYTLCFLLCFSPKNGFDLCNSILLQEPHQVQEHQK